MDLGSALLIESCEVLSDFFLGFMLCTRKGPVGVMQHQLDTGSSARRPAFCIEDDMYPLSQAIFGWFVNI